MKSKMQESVSEPESQKNDLSNNRIGDWLIILYCLVFILLMFTPAFIIFFFQFIWAEFSVFHWFETFFV